MRFIPTSFTPSHVSRAKNVVGISLVQILAGYIYAPVYYFLGHISGAWIIFIGTLFVSATPFFLKWTKNLSIVGHLPAFIMYGIMVGLAYTQDGVGSTSLAWFAAVPIVAVLAMGNRSGVFWGVASAVTIMLFYLLPAWGLELPSNPLDTQKMVLLNSVGTAGLVLYLLGFAVANEMIKDEAFQSMRKMAGEDTLTKLLTRRRFFEKVQQLYSLPSSEVRGVMMIDIDHFKAINDTHGHHAGDIVLKEFGALCRQSLGTNPLCARFGGEEFIVYLDSTTAELLYDLAHKLKSTTQEKVFTIGSHALGITISIGIHHWNGSAEDIDTMIKKADAALYRAKQEGRNRVEIA